MNWHRPVSCAAGRERQMILRAMQDFHRRTPVRFTQYNPATDTDYIHITGENTGCWSWVGRIEGVSNTYTNSHQFMTCHNSSPAYKIRTVLMKLHLFTIQLWVTPTTKRGMLTADFEIYFSKYLFVNTKLCLLQARDCDCATLCFRYTAGCTAVKVATECAFIYGFVGPKTCNIFFFNTSLPLYKMSAVHCITCKALLLSLPSITFLSVTPFHPTVWPNNCDLPKITLPLRTLTVTLHILTLLVFTIDRNDWHVLLTSPGLTACCSFSTDTSHDQASCSDKMALLAWPQLITSFRSLAATATEPPA